MTLNAVRTRYPSSLNWRSLLLLRQSGGGLRDFRRPPGHLLLLCPSRRQMTPAFTRPLCVSGSLRTTGKTGDDDDPLTALPRLEPSRKQEIRKHVFFRFLDYLRSYQAVLDRVLPAKAVQIYKLFLSGSRLLFSDMKEYSWVYSVLSSTYDWEKACGTLTRKQLTLYMTLPNDLFSVMPVLVVSAFPLMQNVIFPLAMMFPKQLLSSHFWTPDVRRQVDQEAQVARHGFYRPLLRDLTKALEMKTAAGGGIRHHYRMCKTVLAKLGSGEGHPSPQDILDLKPIFTDGGAFHLQAISSLHVRHLMKIHGLKDLTRWRQKLQQYGNLLGQIDRAIDREGGVSRLSDEELGRCCLTRGLNVDGLGRQEMEEYLGTWVWVSGQLTSRSTSLLLHLPVLMGYNHKTRYWDSDTVI